MQLELLNPSSVGILIVAGKPKQSCRRIDHLLLKASSFGERLIGINPLCHSFEGTGGQRTFVRGGDWWFASPIGSVAGTNVGVNRSASEMRSSCSVPLLTR